MCYILRLTDGLTQRKKKKKQKRQRGRKSDGHITGTDRKTESARERHADSDTETEKEGGGGEGENESDYRTTRRKPLMTSFRKYHLLKRENPSTNRDLNPHWWQARKADVQSVTPRTGGRLGKQMYKALHHSLVAG